MSKLYWKIRIRLLALRWIAIVNLDDIVKYQGKNYIVANGVRSNSWRLHDLNNGNDGWVKRSECKKVITLANLISSYRKGVRFYMTNWFDIWMNSGIKPYMQGCNIWGGGKPYRLSRKNRQEDNQDG